MLNFVLCDDNQNLLDYLNHMFEKIFFKNNFEAPFIKCINNYTELLNYSKENSIDVLFLDINLKSDINGFELAKKVRKYNKDCYIIFITAHSEFVFLAYQCKTFDYLCKPITFEKLESCILRLFADINECTQKKKYIKIDNKNTIIDENEVQFIKRDGMKIIFCTSNKNYEIYSSFTKIQDKLPNNFIRCHKSFIVNLNKITKLEPSANIIYFQNNISCDIGPKYKESVIKGVNVYE